MSLKTSEAFAHFILPILAVLSLMAVMSIVLFTHFNSVHKNTTANPSSAGTDSTIQTRTPNANTPKTAPSLNKTTTVNDRKPDFEGERFDDD